MEPLPENLDYDRLSLADAARITGKSPNTIRRQKARLIEVGATCDPSGWVVSTTQLAAVGLLDEVKSTEPRKRVQEPLPEPSHITLVKDVYEARINDLKMSLEREKQRADMAEARLERLLPAAPPVEPVEIAQQELDKEKAKQVQPEEKPRGLFWWLFGR